MLFSLELTDIMLSLLFLSLIVLIIFTIIYIRKAIQNADLLKKTLEDVNGVTSVANQRIQQANDAIDHVKEKFEGSDGVISSATSIAKAGFSMISMIKGTKSKSKKEK